MQFRKYILTSTLKVPAGFRSCFSSVSPSRQYLPSQLRSKWKSRNFLLAARHSLAIFRTFFLQAMITSSNSWVATTDLDTAALAGLLDWVAFVLGVFFPAMGSGFFAERGMIIEVKTLRYGNCYCPNIVSDTASIIYTLKTTMKLPASPVCYFSLDATILLTHRIHS